jgi:hypothetical protein
MKNDLAYHNLLQAFAKGCPICILINQNTTRLIDDLLYERVNDSLTRDRIRESFGFCNRHAWQLQTAGDVSGHSIIYADLLTTLAELFASRKVNQRELRPKRICLVCEQEQEVEREYTAKFIAYFHDSKLQNRYSESAGLCLPHICQVLSQTKDAKLHSELLAIERPKLVALSEELKHLLRKFDYRFTKELLGRERDAWIRAIEKVSGRRKTRP